MPPRNEPCKDCNHADPEIQMITKSSIYCKRWGKPVWKDDVTGRACFRQKEEA